MCSVVGWTGVFPHTLESDNNDGGGVKLENLRNKKTQINSVG